MAARSGTLVTAAQQVMSSVTVKSKAQVAKMKLIDKDMTGYI